MLVQQYFTSSSSVAPDPNISEDVVTLIFKRDGMKLHGNLAAEVPKFPPQPRLQTFKELN